MSNLNIFMKNNKGYYSWIHSLKNAAIQSQQKGFEMLKEAREEGGNEALKAQFKKEKELRGSDTNQGGQNRKTDVKPVGNANYVADDAEDGVIGQDAIIPHRENDEPILKVSSSSRSKLSDIKSGAFPPPSVEHPPARFPTPEAAAAEVKRLNSQKDVVATIEAEAENEQRAENYDDEERDRQMTIDMQIDRIMGR
jgi:hypothetical protein